jgi:hypothetical protein
VVELRYDQDDLYPLCDACSQAAAECVLTSSVEVVRRYWDADDSFTDRRLHFLALAPKRREQPDASNIYAGLAVGYLAIGRGNDAILTAALSVRERIDTVNCCSNPTQVLFDERVFRRDLLNELAQFFASAERVNAGEPDSG